MTQRTADVRSGEAFGRVIADIRRTKKMTQADLAENAGVSRAYLSMVESGRTTRLLDMTLRILRILNARIYIVFDDEVDHDKS
jgi:transcriptional regulator with XRE-family HTH domain